MKLLVRVFSALALVILATDLAFAAPLSPSFTYQGQLKQDGSPVTGTRHLRFSLWDAPGSGVPPVGGSQIGASHLLTSVTVSNGLFAVLLNDADQFGANAFNGDARWIQIEICADPGCATLTILSPRQPLTATPFARYAAASGGGAWTVSGPDVYRASGKVGIGIAPGYKLHVDSSSPGTMAYFQTNATSGDNYGVNSHALGIGATTNVAGYFAAAGAAKNFALIVPPGYGKVGLGTTDPRFQLEVASTAVGQAAYIRTDATSGTNYGIDAEAHGVGATTNVAGYFSASGAANNHAIIVPPGNGTVGIGTTSPGYPLEVTSSNQNGTVAFVHSGRPSGDNYAVNGQANGVGANLNVGGYFQATGASNNVAIMVPPSGGNVDIGSYTKLGSDAPAIKTKKLTATSPASNGSAVEVDLGVDMSRILSVAVMINNSGAFWVPPIEDAFNGWGWFLGYPGPTSIRVYIKNRDDCLNRPMKIFITYEE